MGHKVQEDTQEQLVMQDQRDQLEIEEMPENKEFQVQKDPKVQMEIVDQKENQEQ